jgi:hypothetical protein
MSEPEFCLVKIAVHNYLLWGWVRPIVGYIHKEEFEPIEKSEERRYVWFTKIAKLKLKTHVQPK